MMRNLILLVSSAAILLLLFVGYAFLVRDPQPEDRGPARLLQRVQSAPDESAENVLKIGEDVVIPPGEAAEVTIYDPETGWPRYRFRFATWTPVADSPNEVRVTRPLLTMRLPSGMIASASAAEGQITVERIDQPKTPRLGWLRGDARIVVDRETALDRTPPEERPDDLITIDLNELYFDLELGELRSPHHIAVHSTDVDITGTGLSLVWNQADNRVEELTLEHGGELALHAGGGFFRTLSGDHAPATSTTAPATVIPPPARRRGTTYVCSLQGPVTAGHYRGDELLTELQAAELQLLFDFGARSNGFLRTAAPTSSAPATVATTDEPTTAAPSLAERLIVRWEGALSLRPDDSPPPPTGSRRRLLATGQPVTLTQGDGAVRCGTLEYYEDTQQVWLRHGPDGRVQFGLGADLHATAGSVYIDTAHNVVKLLDHVLLKSQRGPAEGGRTVTLTCTEWAELHLATAEPPTDATAPRAASFGRLRSATFVGDALVDLDRQRLGARRLTLEFDPDAADSSVETALRSVTGSGDVHLGGEKQWLECGELGLAFATTAEGTLFASALDATGFVTIADDLSRIRGQRVQADLAPPVADSASDDAPDILLRTLAITGRAELRDPQRRIAARGDEIAATFDGNNRLVAGHVSGPKPLGALVHARSFTIRGARVDLGFESQTVAVDGPSRLSFESQRSLRGEKRPRAERTTITCSRALRVDGQRNHVRFEENVLARTGGEKLRADALTLLLEDVAQPPASQPSFAATPTGALIRNIRQLFAAPPESSPFAVRVERDDTRFRKEPVRVVAENATLDSDSDLDPTGQPRVYSSLSAPHLEVTLPARRLRTTGQTTLALLSRKLGGLTSSAAASDPALSAIMSDGPSQTVMQCDQALTYVLGEEGPQRSDLVILEGGVWLLHRAGQAVLRLEDMLPDSQADAELAANLPRRKTKLDCRRLECELVSGAAADAPSSRNPAATDRLRLNWLLATGNVYVRDQIDSVIRELHAAQVEFSRELGLVSIRGSADADARVYTMNPDRGQFDMPAVGPAIDINLRTNEIRARQIAGEFSRP